MSNRAGIVALFLALLHLIASAARADIVDPLDQPAPEIVAGAWWNGAAPKLEALKGKVVVLHVSDPARATSKAFLPNLVKWTEAYKSQPVVLVEVVESGEKDVAQSYVTECAGEVKWLVGWDGVGTIQRGYPGSSVPRTYVIGPDGQVAWHAHVAALTKEVLDAQVVRCTFWDVQSVPAAARLAAKAMLDLRFGDALSAADKVFTDPYAPPEAKTYCARVKKEIARYYAFQKGVADALIKELDWAVAYHRVERMLVIYKGTDHMAEVESMKAGLDANPRVKFIIEAQKKLDGIVKDVGHLGPTDLAKVVEKLKAFMEEFPESAPAKKASEWIAECERRIARKK